MKFVPIQCPCCNANINADIEKKIMYCGHCGTQIYIDDEVKRYEYTYRTINDAEIRQADAEIRQADLKMKEAEFRRDIEMHRLQARKTSLMIKLVIVIIMMAPCIIPFILLFIATILEPFGIHLDMN